jgi:hypothetical protein
VNKERGQFGIPQEKERPPMEAVTKELVKTAIDDTNICVCVCVCVCVYNGDLFHFKYLF